MKARSARIFGALIFCVLLTGCDALYRMLDKEGAEEKELVGDVVPFEANPTIEEIQMLLNIYGYSSGKVDGILGLRTRDAIEKFQKDNGLKETRFVDDATWTLLREFKDNGFIIDGAINIEKIQTALTSAGFNPGKIDGKMGIKTESAIRLFQKANNLNSDGKIGYNTLTALSSFVETSSANTEFPQ